MGDRRRARELALQALFYCDMNPSEADSWFESFCEVNEEELIQSVRRFLGNSSRVWGSTGIKLTRC